MVNIGARSTDCSDPGDISQGGGREGLPAEPIKLLSICMKIKREGRWRPQPATPHSPAYSQFKDTKLKYMI